jgi:hypothetical protein
MAGTIIADFIRTDANRLSLNVGNTTFATINASGFFSNTGIQLIAANGTIATSALSGTIATSALSGTIATSQLADSAITKAKIGYAGAVLQAGNVPALIDRNTTVDTTTFTTLYTLSITPSKTNTRILFYTNWMIFIQTSANYACDHRILANGSTVLNGAQDSHNPYFTGASGFALMHRGAGMRSHDPGTTSTQSYAIQFAKASADRGAMNFSHNSEYNSSLMWMEVQL